MTGLSFDEMAALLAASKTHKVLRKLDPSARQKDVFESAADTRIAIVLDVETTGLSPQRDSILQLAMVPLTYDKAGRVLQVLPAFSAYQDPGRPISPLVRVLTGIEDAMVAGHSIDSKAVASFVSQADIIIAHNAKFDRAFVEKQFPEAFAGMPFACSMSQIAWADYGFEGTKLAYLCQQSGFWFDAHDAVNDCHATIELLANRLPNSDRTALDVLLENAVRPTVRIWAENAPFEKKEILKSRGYRWQGEGQGKIRAWYIDLSPEQMESELQFLRREIMSDEPLAAEITALDRFSDRI